MTVIKATTPQTKDRTRTPVPTCFTARKNALHFPITQAASKPIQITEPAIINGNKTQEGMTVC